MIKVTSTVKGDLEKFVLEESNRTGLSNAAVMVQLALQGMEYKQGLKSLVVLSAALEEENSKKNAG